MHVLHCAWKCIQSESVNCVAKGIPWSAYDVRSMADSLEVAHLEEKLDLVVSQVVPAGQGVIIVRVYETSPLEPTRRAQKVQHDQVYSKMPLRWQYNIRTMSMLSTKYIMRLVLTSVSESSRCFQERNECCRSG